MQFSAGVIRQQALACGYAPANCSQQRVKTSRLTTGQLLTWLLVGLFICGSLVVHNGHAANSQPSNSAPSIAQTPTLDTLDIIGSTAVGERTGDVVDSEFVGSRRTVQRERLEQPGVQLTDLLASISGVQQRQSGGFGTYSAVTVRAATAAQTAVYLDGVLLNSASEPVIDLSTLEILNLNSVDLYKGSSPLQLGHGSIGGAINLNTLDARESQGTRVRLGLGSFSQASLSAANQGSHGRWDWTGTISHRQSENDFAFLHDNGTERNPADDTRQRRANNQFERSSALLKSGYQASDDYRTDVLLQISDRNIGVPNVSNSASNNASYNTLKTQAHLSQVIDGWLGWNTRHSLFLHRSESLYDDLRGSNDLRAQYIDTDISTTGIKSYWERFIDTGTIGLSAELRDESLRLVDETDINQQLTVSQQQLLLTTHWAIVAGNDRWMITPAFRWQGNQREGVPHSIDTSDELLTLDESQFGAQLGAEYQLSPTVSVDFNVANHFRAPTFNELYGSIGLINGNPTLVAEKGTNLELGLRMATDALTIQASVFHSLRDELIVTSFNARGIGRPDNTGKARVSGLELSLDWTPMARWSLSANTTIQNPRNLEPRRGFEGRQLPGEARLSSFARLQYQPEEVAYWYEWHSTRERFYDSANLLPAANTSTHHIGLDIRKRHWQFSATIQNIGDDTVEDFNGFPKPGRNFSIAVTRTL